MLRTNLCVNAATGKMGQQITHQIFESELADLSSALCRAEHPYHNQKISEFHDVQYTSDTLAGLSLSQVAIDFSLPVVSLALLEKAVKSKTPLLIGTTGFSNVQLKTIKKAAKSIPVLLAPNTSIGVNVTMALLAKAASLLGEQANIEIIEAHHKHKVDAPSGTALKFAEVICDATNTHLKDRAVYQRNQSKTARTEDEIGFSVIRAGEIIGEHKVIFALNNEIISLEHKAQSRKCFAEGAIKAAVWLSKQNNGFYSMQDFLAE